MASVHSGRRSSELQLRDSWNIEGLEVGIIVWFSPEELVAINLFPYSGGTSWDEWSEAKALSQRDALEKLLTSNYAGRRTFAWGEVISSYDPRSASSSISIRYAGAPSIA